MTYIDETNFETKMPPEVRDLYWLEVEAALIKRGASPELSRAYRKEMEARTIGEQIAVYHFSPEHLATDLIGP